MTSSSGMYAASSDPWALSTDAKMSQLLSSGPLSAYLGPSAPAPPPPMEPTKRQRFDEPQKMLPVMFVVCVICFLFWSYLWCHIFPLLQLKAPHAKVDHDMRQRALIELIAFLYFTTLLVICYVRSILEHPGEIPENDPQWEYAADGRSTVDVAPAALQEMKKTGERRHCKWCGKYKPDRCHHCRVCRCCILKMDHHCPWIYNCVGFGNYKFFFLLLFYTALDTHLIMWTMTETVKRCIDDVNTPFHTMFIVFFTETLTSFLAALVSAFFTFHIVLMMKAMTTIEFCEKRMPKRGSDPKMVQTSVYHLGAWGNIRAILGNNVLLWAFPCARPPGDGLYFMSDDTRLTADLESGKGTRLRSHQRTQRTVRTPRGTSLNPGSYGSYLSYGTMPYGGAGRG